MARVSFRDRFFSPPVARAITSPLGIILFGAGTALGIIAGLGIVAPLVGVVAWAGRVLVSVPRNQRGRIDAYTLSEPWKQHVLQAQSAVARFNRTVDRSVDGPTKDRLKAMASRLDDGLMDCWRIARRGDELDAALATLSTDEAAAELADLEARVAGAGVTPSVSQTMDALRAQLASAARLRSTRSDAADRLELLDARFDEIVARGVEVSVGSGDSRGLDDDVTGLVTDLEALRQALEEVDRVAGTEAAEAPMPQTFPPPDQ